MAAWLASWLTCWLTARLSRGLAWPGLALSGLACIVVRLAAAKVDSLKRSGPFSASCCLSDSGSHQRDCDGAQSMRSGVSFAPESIPIDNETWPHRGSRVKATSGDNNSPIYGRDDGSTLGV